MSRPFKFALGATVRQERAGHEISEDDLRAVNEHTLTPVSAKDVAVFKMDLCNDKIDKHISRLPKEELQHISDHLIVGKPLMVNHDMPGPFSKGSLPVGRFFRSQLLKENGTTSVQPDVFV